jgi:hypothetical protein
VYRIVGPLRLDPRRGGTDLDARTVAVTYDDRGSAKENAALSDAAKHGILIGGGFASGNTRPACFSE